MRSRTRRSLASCALVMCLFHSGQDLMETALPRISRQLLGGLFVQRLAKCFRCPAGLERAVE